MLSNYGAEDSWVSWTVRKSNQLILKEVNPEYSWEGLMLKLKLQSFGHLMWRANSMEKTLILGKIEGRRRRGWQTNAQEWDWKIIWPCVYFEWNNIPANSSPQWQQAHLVLRGWFLNHSPVKRSRTLIECLIPGWVIRWGEDILQCSANQRTGFSKGHWSNLEKLGNKFNDIMLDYNPGIK